MSSLNDMKKMSAQLTRLAASIALMFCAGASVTAHAMEAIDEQTLSDTTGADGLVVNSQASSVSFGSLYWQDGASGTGSALAMQGATLTPFSATATLNTGSTGSTSALSLNLNLGATLFTAPTLTICTGVASGSPSGCSTSMGAIAAQTLNPTTFSLVTSNGLLNSAGSAAVKLLLNDANIFFTSNGNQLVTSDIYANISANGRIWVDATDGFRFSTAGGSGATGTPGVTLTAPGSWTTPGVPLNAGLQASLVMQNGTTNSLSSSPNGIIAFGASGSLPTLDLTVRGVSATGTGTSAEDNLGSVIGNAGIAANMTATIQSGTGTNGFQLDLGAAGAGGYGIQLTNFVPFSNVTSTNNPSITTGNVYLGLLTATTTSLLMPIPTALTNGMGADNKTSAANNFFTSTPTTNDFPAADATSHQDTQTITGANSLLFAIRGLSIQGVAKSTAFYENGLGLCTGTVTCFSGSGVVTGFAIMPVLYGVSGNLTLNASTATSLAYSLALSIVGNNGGTTETGTTPSTDIQESAFFLTDTSGSTPQYIGLRDINMYLKANGLITFGGTTTTNTLNITLPNFLLVMSANLAAGYLPGADVAAGVPTANNFINNKDTLVTMNIGLQSDATYFSNNALTVTTTSATPSTLGLSADLTLAGSTGTTATGAAPNQAAATGDFFRIIDSSGSALGLDNITGRIQLSTGSALIVGPYTDPSTGITTNADSGTLHSILTVNPQDIKGNELLATLDFYPSGGSAQTIGKMVLTGGTITSNLTLTPVTH